MENDGIEYLMEIFGEYRVEKPLHYSAIVHVYLDDNSLMTFCNSWISLYPSDNNGNYYWSRGMRYSFR